MVSTAAIFCMIFTLFVCFIAPIPFVIALCKKEKGLISLIFLGMSGFVVTQMVIRIPILSMPQAQSFLSSLPVLLSYLLLAFTAGLFETAGRFGVFKIFMKNKNSAEAGMAAGLGHGWIEAVLIVGMTYINNIIIAFMLNSGGVDAIEGMVGAEMAESVASTFTSTHASLFFLAGAERFFTMGLHIALSLLLWSYIKKGKPLKGFIYTVTAHMSVDFFIPLIQKYTGSALVTECFMAVVFIASVFAALKIKKNMECEQEDAASEDLAL